MTAIFITDEMFEATNRLAHKMGLSLNELYANAIREYLNRHKDENLIDQINAVCDQVDTSVDPAIRLMQAYSIPKEEW